MNKFSIFFPFSILHKQVFNICIIILNKIDKKRCIMSSRKISIFFFLIFHLYYYYCIK